MRYVYFANWFLRYCFLPDSTLERMSHHALRRVASRRPAAQTPIEIFASKRAEEPSVDHDGGSNELVDLMLDPGLDILFDEPDFPSERAAGLGNRPRGSEKPQ